MGILDDIKSSVDGRSSSDSLDELDSSLDNSAAGSAGNTRGGTNRVSDRGATGRDISRSPEENPPGRSQEGLTGGADRRSRGQNNVLGQNSGGQGNAPANSPNPQTGQPQPGRSKPQVTDTTRREMKNAGIDSESNVERKLEDIEKQNDQMIQILQRIERNLR